MPDFNDSFTARQRYAEILTALISDQGGTTRLSEAKLQLLRRFTACSLVAEGIEAHLMRGEEIDPSELASVSNILLRIGQAIGLGRASQNTTESLADILRAT